MVIAGVNIIFVGLNTLAHTVPPHEHCASLCLLLIIQKVSTLKKFLGFLSSKVWGKMHISERLRMLGKMGITEVLLSQGCRGMYIVFF